MSQEETRQRIVEATVYLHEKIGVPGTTISAIAERAGVERLTVYRHFPDDHTLLTACTGHYLSQNPVPDPEQWESIEEPVPCLRAALAKIYAYYRQTEGMMITAYRDTQTEPTLLEVLAPFFQYWASIQNHLAEKFSATSPAHPLMLAVVGHAIHFSTWRSLVKQQGLKMDQAVNIMVAMVQSIDVSQHQPPD